MQTSSLYTYIPLIKTIVRKNNNEQDKNNYLNTYSDFSGLINTTLNLFSYHLLTEFVGINWHINFINMMEKSILQAHSIMILTKILHIIKAFEYLKYLWDIYSDATNHICMNW